MRKQNLSETYGTRQLRGLLTTASMRSATGEKERATGRVSVRRQDTWRRDQTIYQHTHTGSLLPITSGTCSGTASGGTSGTTSASTPGTGPPQGVPSRCQSRNGTRYHFFPFVPFFPPGAGVPGSELGTGLGGTVGGVVVGSPAGVVVGGGALWVGDV
jgi:hypothetical protein